MRSCLHWTILSLLFSVLVACGGGSSSSPSEPDNSNQGPTSGYQLLGEAQGLSGEAQLRIELLASSNENAAVVRELTLTMGGQGTQILLDNIQIGQLARVELVSLPQNQLCEIGPQLAFEFTQQQNLQLKLVCQQLVQAQINFSKPAAFDFNQLSIASIFEENSDLQSASVNMALTPNSLVWLKSKPGLNSPERVIYSGIVTDQNTLLIDEFSTALSLLLQENAIAKAIAERNISLSQVVTLAREQRASLPGLQALYQTIATAANTDNFDLLGQIGQNPAIEAAIYPALKELAALIVANFDPLVYQPQIQGDILYQDDSLIFSQRVNAQDTQFYLYNLGERYLSVKADTSNPAWGALTQLLEPSSENTITINNQALVNQEINFKASAASARLLTQADANGLGTQDLGNYFSRHYLYSGILQFLSQSNFDAKSCLGEAKLRDLNEQLDAKLASFNEPRALFSYQPFNALSLEQIAALDFSISNSSSSPNFILAEFKASGAGKFLYCDQLALANYLVEIDASKQVQAIKYFKQLLAINRISLAAVDAHLNKVDTADNLQPPGLFFTPDSQLTRFGYALANLDALSQWQYTQRYRLELNLDNNVIALGEALQASARCLDDQNRAAPCQLSWNLGDENTIEANTLDYVYQQAGNYTLELSAQIQGVEVAKVRRNIRVQAPKTSISLQNAAGIVIDKQEVSTLVGANYRLPLRVLNSGNVSYALDFTLNGDAGFALLDSQNQAIANVLALKPGEVINLVLSFNADQVGDYTTRLQVSNNDDLVALDVDIKVAEQVSAGQFGYWLQQDIAYEINRVEPIQAFTASGFAVIKAYSDDANTPALFIKLYDYLGIGNYSLSDRGNESALGFVSYGIDLADNYRTVGSSSPLFSAAPASGTVSISESDEPDYYRVDFNFNAYAQDCVSSALCQYENVRGEFKMLKP